MGGRYSPPEQKAASHTATLSGYTGSKFLIGFVYLMAKVLDMTDPRNPVPYRRAELSLMESAIEWIDFSHFRRKIVKVLLSKRIVKHAPYIPFDLPPDGFDNMIGVKVEGIKQPRALASMELAEHISRTYYDKRRLSAEARQFASRAIAQL
jgi:hypothetical protein